MEIKVTSSMLPDLLAASALLTLSVYHLMIYWGRRRDPDEVYNLFFAIFVLTAMLFILAPYFQPQHFLFAYKPEWIHVINMEMLLTWMLFYSGVKFLNRLLKFPPPLQKRFRITFATLPVAFLLTLTSNFIGTAFYFRYIMIYVLAIVAINVVVIYTVYGYWIRREKLFKDNYVRVFYFGFVLLTINILVYRTIELATIPNVLIFNHYISAVILFGFAYALSVKFNREHNELKELKAELEKKVADRTEDLRKSNKELEQTNREIKDQRQEILAINEQLSFQAEDLKELDEVKSRFFTNISHEFRTPLTLIIGPLESMLPSTANEKQRTDYQMMLRQARRLLSLVNQLLELSKAEKGMLKLNVFHDNFSRYLRLLVSSFKSLAEERKVKLSLDEKISDQYFAFDKDKIEKIVTNLIVNALKFTPSDGNVEIILRQGGSADVVEIVVLDTGVGIQEDQLQSIFDPFYQEDSSIATGLEGTGIGLSLVKELVELHQGHISVKSQKGKGSEFIVQLPIELQSSAGERNSGRLSEYAVDESNERLPEEASTRKQKEKPIILIVEDNDDMRYYIRSHLHNEFEVIEASDGVAGMDIARRVVPDLIVADIMMPGMNGLEMTKAIKHEECLSHIPVIILTAKATDDNKIEGLQTQADDYLTKPFNAKELSIRIKNLIAIRQKLRDRFSKNLTVTPSDIVTTSLDEKFLLRALALVEENMSEPKFSAVHFCEGVNMSRAQVHRKLKALTDQSVTEFIRTIRLKRAAQLLRQNSGSVSEIAYQTGFNNLSYFTRCFKEQFDVLPSSFHDQVIG